MARKKKPRSRSRRRDANPQTLAAGAAPAAPQGRDERRIPGPATEALLASAEACDWVLDLSPSKDATDTAVAIGALYALQHRLQPHIPVREAACIQSAADRVCAQRIARANEQIHETGVIADDAEWLHTVTRGAESTVLEVLACVEDDGALTAEYASAIGALTLCEVVRRWLRFMYPSPSAMGDDLSDSDDILSVWRPMNGLDVRILALLGVLRRRALKGARHCSEVGRDEVLHLLGPGDVVAVRKTNAKLWREPEGQSIGRLSNAAVAAAPGPILDFVVQEMAIGVDKLFVLRDVFSS